jgi:FkbM family methyltransferase
MSTVTTTEVRGVSMQLVTHTRALALCARMNYETEVLDFIDQIQPGEVLYDLGACEGRFALYAALRQVQCYAFEPEALNFQALQENIALNGERASTHLTPYQYAVGERNYQTTLKIAQPWAGGHQKVIATAPSRVDLDFAFSQSQEVEVVALDEFIATRQLPLPHYLKVDVDGSEQPFVAGARNTLSNPHLKAVIFELCQEDEGFQAIIEALASCSLIVQQSHQVEPGLFNFAFTRRHETSAKPAQRSA